VLAACAPAVLDRLLGRDPVWPEGSQLKVNMLLDRLPRLRANVDPASAFSGTFHINETASQLATAYAEATAGRVPSLPPAEIYCHTLTDRTILGGPLRDGASHTLTVFALHQPAALFRADPDAARAAALAATLASLDSVLDEPITECIATAPDGSACIEARSPVDLERELAMPGGHIFHGDLSWPWSEGEADRWGVATENPRVLLAGAGGRRGGGVSGIAGRDAAMAVLGR
jgi:phytoene dehydrogenase-like protein